MRAQKGFLEEATLDLGLEGQVRVSQGEDGKWEECGEKSLGNGCQGVIWLFSVGACVTGLSKNCP